LTHINEQSKEMRQGYGVGAR